MLDNLESEQLIDTLTEPLPDIPYRPKMISLDDDVTATFAELVTTYGYFSTEHTVTTSDGYVLTVWRVNKTATPSGNPVFIQHGLFGDGVVWTLNKQKSLAFVLANAGYDVWIGNNRGNQFSRTNINLDIVTQAKQWFDFSFFELGQYDAPAQIDYVIKTTGKAKVSYIGYSQGTSQMFSALSHNHGNLQNKINLFIALAPVIEMNNTTDPLYVNGASVWKILKNALDNYKLYELGDPDDNPNMNSFCGSFLWKSICTGLHNDANDAPSQWNDPARTAVQNSRKKSNASVKEIVHFAQIVKSDYFIQYDYGSSANNRARYGGTTIPQIPVESIKNVPIAFFVGLQDSLADPVDT